MVKKNIPKLSNNKITIIKNVEKDSGWMETWYKGRNLACIPHSFRCLFLGGVGRGKTNSMKNVFLAHQQSKKPFKKLYIITCDIDSREWLDCEPTQIMDELPDLDLFDPTEKTCLIIDDYEFTKINKEELRKLSTLFRFVSSHRNVSIMCSYQSWFDVPNIARKCANCYVIYKPNSNLEISTIANRVGLEPDELHTIFNDICNGTYDSLMVDLTIGSPCKLRKNIYEPITI